ncbi:MAG: hypothetical protein ABWZ25_17580 [Chitinophagaceae bacterium]
MLAAYNKFCCGIYFLFRDYTGSDVPFFATFTFTLFLVMLSFYGVENLYEILTTEPLTSTRWVGLFVSLIFGIPNYFFVFRDEKFLNYSREKVHPILVVVIVVVIAAFFLTTMGIKGPRIPYHKG